MNVQITVNGNDVTYRLDSYTRDENICNSSGFLTFTLNGISLGTLNFNQTVILYEEGIRKGTYLLDSITENIPPGSLEVHATNNEKKLEDTFIPDLYYIKDTPFLKTRYWIEKFLTDSGISYSFNVSGDGEYLMEDDILGGTNCSEILTKLLAYSGWYIRFDAYGTAIVGKLEYGLGNYSQSYGDSVILDIDNVLDDSTLRNRAVVWGRTHPRTGEWIYSDMSIDTPWNYDSNDKRTVLISNPYIASEEVAASIASQVLKTFSKPKYVKKIRIAGASNVNLGNVVMINSVHFRGTGLVTQLDSEMSPGGLITSLTLDYPCPRLIGALTYTAEDSLNYVYVGTQGNGVWRRHLTSISGVWQNFSTGLLDLNVVDLDVNNGVFACVTSGGSLYTRYLDENTWTRYDPGMFNDGLGNYLSSGVFCIACAIDKVTSDIYGVHNLRSAFRYSGGNWEITPGVRSWLTTITGSGGSLITNIVHTGSGLVGFGSNEIAALDVDNNGDGTYITGMTVPVPTPGGNPFPPEPPGGLHIVSTLGVEPMFIGYTAVTSLNTEYNYNSMIPTISGATIEMSDPGNVYNMSVAWGNNVYYIDGTDIVRYNYKNHTKNTVTSSFTGTSAPTHLHVYSEDIAILVPDLPINNGVFREWYLEKIDFEVGMATRKLINRLDTTGKFYTAKYKGSYMLYNQLIYLYEYGDLFVRTYNVSGDSVGGEIKAFDVLTPSYKSNFDVHFYSPLYGDVIGYIQYSISGVLHYYAFRCNSGGGSKGDEITGIPGTQWVPDYINGALSGNWTDESSTLHYCTVNSSGIPTFTYSPNNVVKVCSSKTKVYYITSYGTRFDVYEQDGTFIGSLDSSLTPTTGLILSVMDDANNGIVTYNYYTHVLERHTFGPYTRTTIVSSIPSSAYIWCNFMGEKIIVAGRYIYWLDTDETKIGDGGGSSTESIFPIIGYKNLHFSGVGYWTYPAYHIDMSQSFPSILYGGTGEGVLDTGTLVIYDTDWDSALVNLIYSGAEGLRGGNEVTDVKSYTETTVDGFYRRSIFATNSPTTSGTSFIRILDYDDRLISNPSFNTYETKNETIQLRGTINHLETSNSNDKPFIFASTKILESGSKFYQRTGYDLRDAPQEFVDKSVGLPSSEITVIRVDDTI